VLVAPQILLLWQIDTPGGAAAYVRRAVPFLLIGMPFAAWAV